MKRWTQNFVKKFSHLENIIPFELLFFFVWSYVYAFEDRFQNSSSSFKGYGVLSIFNIIINYRCVAKCQKTAFYINRRRISGILWYFGKVIWQRLVLYKRPELSRKRFQSLWPHGLLTSEPCKKDSWTAYIAESQNLQTLVVGMKLYWLESKVDYTVPGM